MGCKPLAGPWTADGRRSRPWANLGPSSESVAWSTRTAALPRPRVCPDWCGQALVLAVIALLGLVPFWLTDLDLLVASNLYRPGSDDPWLLGQGPLWLFLYRLVPLLTGALVIGALLVLAAGVLLGQLRPLGLYAVLVLSVILVGPGLLINGVFKNSWDRPRPHQVETFGGTRDYLPPLARGDAGGGKSFPSGHSSMGYLLGIFYLIWRRGRPRLARAALALALTLGTLIGVGRMTAGDHFLSDVIWSGIIVHTSTLILYYGVLRIPSRELARPACPMAIAARPRRPRLLLLGHSVLGLVLLSGVLLATPINGTMRELLTPGEFEPDPRVVRIEADYLDLILHEIDGPGLGLVRLQARGFGLPSARVEQDLRAQDGILTYRLTHKGVFTERDTKLVVGLAAGHWDRIEARVAKGDIRVQRLGLTAPQLDLSSADGSVVLE